MDPTLAYHLEELAAARDPADPRHCLAPLRDDDRAVLDIGCGIGQGVAAHCAGRDDLTVVGIDIDPVPLRHGAQAFAHAHFARASGDQLPFADGSFDLVCSRVSLPYMHVPRAIGEMRRVLRPGGRVWLTLHPVSRTWRELGRAITRRQPRDVVFRLYVMGNGALLHLFGRSIPFFANGRHESFQTVAGMHRVLQRHGFDEIRIERGRHFVLSATRR